MGRPGLQSSGRSYSFRGVSDLISGGRDYIGSRPRGIFTKLDKIMMW